MTQKSRVPLTSIYRVFFEIGMFSFGGGVSGWIYRDIVEMRKWMSHEEYLSGVALTQIMPGPNATNSAIYIGQLLRGASGATVALLAMLTGPFLAILVAAFTYQWLLGLPGFQEAMIGTAAAAIGMLLRTGLTSARMVARGLAPILIMTATFIAVGIFHIGLVPVICVIGPLSVAYAYKMSGRRLEHE